VTISGSTWSQVKNITAADLCAALEKDGFSCDMNGGSMRIYKKGSARISVHFHPKKTFGPKLLKSLLDDTGWSDDDLRRLKVIK